MITTKQEIKNMVEGLTEPELVELVLTLINALDAANFGLRGEYPHYIHGKATQKESREAALAIVDRAQSQAHQLILAAIKATPEYLERERAQDEARQAAELVGAELDQDLAEHEPGADSFLVHCPYCNSTDTERQSPAAWVEAGLEPLPEGWVGYFCRYSGDRFSVRTS